MGAKDVPARVVLLEIPSRNELRVKNLFNVADCKMHWQKSGDYLCVMVNRYKKILTDNADRKYAGLYYNFEVFHMLEKQIPVDTVKIEEQIKEIKKNLKKYSVKFNQKDTQRSNKASAELAARRQKLMSSFSEWKEQKEEEYAMARDKRMALRDGIDTDYDEGDQFEEETVEFLIKEEETIIQD